jgi:hypothetical protein
MINGFNFEGAKIIIILFDARFGRFFFANGRYCRFSKGEPHPRPLSHFRSHSHSVFAPSGEPHPRPLSLEERGAIN